MELQLTPASQGAVLEVNDATFACEFNEALVHQVVTAYLAAGRAGTRAQKTRSQVRGGGKKPWKQKGGGRARAGTSRSPIWRGGGRTFAAVPADHSQKVNKKMYRGAMRAILSELVRQERLIVVDEFSLAEIGTKQLLSKLTSLNVTEALIVTESLDEKLYLSARNLHRVQVCEAKEIDPVSLVGFDKVLITVAALKQVEGGLQ